MTNLRKSPLTKALDRNHQAAKKGGSARKFNRIVWPRYNGNRKAKETILYMSLSYGKQKLPPFSTGIKCDPAKFDSKTMSIKGDADNTYELRDMVQKAESYYRELRLTQRPIDLALIKATVLGLYINGVPSLTKTIDDFFDTMTAELNADMMGKGNWRKIRGFHKHLIAFAENRYSKNAPLEAVVPADARAMLTYLQANRKLCANVAGAIVSHFKRILNYALENEWITRNPFMSFSKKDTPKPKARLTKEELEKLQSIKIFSESLDRTRWVFLFDAYTGLSHVDLYKLTPADVRYTSDGDAFISLNRTKSKQPTIVYLPTVCLDIIERFKDDPYRLQTGKLLPVVSNQKMNQLLKEIAGLANIEKHLTCHVGRHTFLNLLYQTATDEKAMRAAAGHSGMETMRTHYIEYNPDAIVRELKRNIG